jgi:transposase
VVLTNEEETMRRIHDRVAGLDVHRDEVTACAEWIDQKEVVRQTGTFRTTVAGVNKLGDWLDGLGVTHVMMESTGVYWKPVLYGLEHRFSEVALVNAQHVKNVPGRKTDMSDAAWLADLAAHGMVRASFVPPPEIRALRELTRYRKQMTRNRVQEIQRLEKVFQDAGIKFTSVASEVWLKSSRVMVEALITGQRDPRVLAELSKGKLRSKRPALVEAMENRWAPHHSALAGALIAHIDVLDARIADLSAQIALRATPWNDQIELLQSAPGVGRLVAEVIIAETGADMTVFGDANHLAAWCGLAPGNHQSAGRRRNAPVGHGNSTIKAIMVEAAKAAVRHNGFLRARHAKIARRRGPNKATVAVARSLTVGIWHMLTNNEPWKDLGGDYYSSRRDPTKEANWHLAALRNLGYDVDLKANPA